MGTFSWCSWALFEVGITFLPLSICLASYHNLFILICNDFVQLTKLILHLPYANMFPLLICIFPSIFLIFLPGLHCKHIRQEGKSFDNRFTCSWNRSRAQATYPEKFFTLDMCCVLYRVSAVPIIAKEFLANICSRGCLIAPNIVKQ